MSRLVSYSYLPVLLLNATSVVVTAGGLELARKDQETRRKGDTHLLTYSPETRRFQSVPEPGVAGEGVYHHPREGVVGRQVTFHLRPSGSKCIVPLCLEVLSTNSCF